MDKSAIASDLSVAMRYVEVTPSEPLRRLVRRFWFLEGEATDPLPIAPAEPILPDGSPELIFNLADRFAARGPTGAAVRQPALMLVGQITGPFLVGPTGRVDIAAVRFEPNGASALIGDFSNLTGRWIDGNQLAAGPGLQALWNRLGEARTSAARALILDDALTRLLPARPGLDRRVEAAVRAIRRGPGPVSISALVRDLNTSTRQLERGFADQVGLPPKVLVRITRFQRVFAAVRDGGESWATVAVRCGYYDQSHLVRDFREFAGYTPSAFLVEQPRLTRLFTALRPGSRA